MIRKSESWSKTYDSYCAIVFNRGSSEPTNQIYSSGLGRGQTVRLEMPLSQPCNRLATDLPIHQVFRLSPFQNPVADPLNQSREWRTFCGEEAVLLLLLLLVRLVDHNFLTPPTTHQHQRGSDIDCTMPIRRLARSQTSCTAREQVLLTRSLTCCWLEMYTTSFSGLDRLPPPRRSVSHSGLLLKV